MKKCLKFSRRSQRVSSKKSKISQKINTLFKKSKKALRKFNGIKSQTHRKTTERRHLQALNYLEDKKLFDMESQHLLPSDTVSSNSSDYFD